MVKNQKCKNCKNYFAENAPQKNYALYATYGFKDEEKFRTHNAANKNCPFKASLPREADQSAQEDGDADSIPDVDWGPYIAGISICEDDYAEDQEMMALQLRKHNRGGRPLWFPNSEEAACLILNEILNPDTQFITLVAEPGSGKTAVIHNLTYRIAMLPYDKAIHPNCITNTTGMSDTNWFDQFIDNFKLRDGEYLWKPINKVNENHCVVHRSTLRKRIGWLLDHPEYISNSIIIIDENHIADELEMTIDNEFRRMGLTEAKMKEYNIKIINVSATPDVSLSIMSKQENHKMVILDNGETYKGFEYYLNRGMIVDYTSAVSLETIIEKYLTPRYHYIRARTRQENGAYRESIITFGNKNGWRIIEDDSSNNYYLSFKADANEKTAMESGKIVVRTYLRPSVHTIILIKNKYPASKRLKLTQYTGLVVEKPADKMNTTVTCNGLIPRFWGYDDLPEFPQNQLPMFICNKSCVEEYIKFKSDFVYDGKSYTGNRIVSNKYTVKELRNTWCGKMSGGEPSAKDTRIGISEPFDSVELIGEFLRETAGFENVRDINEFSRGPNGYIYPRRSPTHNSEETRLTRSVYVENFVKNGGGTHINRQWLNGGSGQPYMIWPVYETMDSEPDSVQYYVHYLKMNQLQDVETNEEELRGADRVAAFFQRSVHYTADSASI